MIDAPIQTSFVSQTAPLGFADAADEAERLVGQTVTEGRARLEIGPRLGHEDGGAEWFAGLLHTGSRWFRPVPVDVVVSPWSAGRTEIGLRPLRRLGGFYSVRAGRFYQAAWAVLPRLVGRMAVPSVAAPSSAEVRIAA